MSEANDGRIASFLKEHPRLMGLLFAALTYLSTSGLAVAGSENCTKCGP